MSDLDSLLYYAQVLVGNELWISNIRFNGLFKINIESGEVVFIGRFPSHDLETEDLHLFAKKYGNKLYFFPKRSNGLDIYDLKTKSFTFATCKMGNSNDYFTAIDAFRIDDERVLIVPCYSNMSLLEFSIEKEAIVRIIELTESNKFVDNATGTMTLYACKMQNEILYPIHGTNKVGSYNFSENKEKVYSIESLKSIVGDIIFDGSYLWVNADQGIYRWNPFKSDLKLVCDCSTEKEGWIEQLILYNENVICIPRWLNNIKIIDRRSFEQREVHIDNHLLSENAVMAWRDVRESFIWNDNLIICPVKYKEEISINLINFEIIYKIHEFLKTFPIKERFFIYERVKEDLRDYIEFVNKKETVFQEKDDCHMGFSILEELKAVVDW